MIHPASIVMYNVVISEVYIYYCFNELWIEADGEICKRKTAKRRDVLQLSLYAFIMA